MVYVDLEAWQAKRKEIEDEWPEYKNSTLMLSRPEYQQDQSMPAVTWKTAYL